MKNPYTKDEILEALRAAFSRVQLAINTYDQRQVFELEGPERWSAAGHFQHLIKSSFPVASAFKSPKERLSAFGKPKDHFVSFAALRDRYKREVVNVKAPANVQPDLTAEDSAESLIANWQMILQKLCDRLEGWNENELDRYTLPHPLLGMLSARQMLYFTIFHADHHLAIIHRIQEAQTV